MAQKMIDLTQRNAAKVAGFTIVIMAIAAVISTDATIGKLFVSGNASKTFTNISASPLLFRTGIFSWLVILVCDVLAAWGLYLFFKPVNKKLSLISAWFRLIYVAILGTAIVSLIDVLPYLSESEYLSTLDTEYLRAQVLFSVDSFYNIWAFGLIVFGIHILFLGYLAVKSGFVPRILGILLLLAFLGYIITNSSNLLFPQYKNAMKIVELIFLIPMLGEVALGIWLLYKGFKREAVQ